VVADFIVDVGLRILSGKGQDPVESLYAGVARKSSPQCNVARNEVRLVAR
jgi:hypothetical protein